jgi:Na+-transporting methylmalonyl-CoA/oxaloacetate decarboxylase beta subunit
VTEVLQSTGLLHLEWRELVMIGIACLLIWLAVVKRFEPLLLVPIGFGALLANLPLAGLMNPPSGADNGGLFYYLFF